MRYEHIELDISTVCCDQLLRALDHITETESLTASILNLRNELVARLQRRDVDPHCPKNVTSEDWLDT